MLNVLKKEQFAQMEISKVKVSDAKLFLIKLQQDEELCRITPETQKSGNACKIGINPHKSA